MSYMEEMERVKGTTLGVISEPGDEDREETKTEDLLDSWKGYIKTYLTVKGRKPLTPIFKKKVSSTKV